jgi:hypothetical protein
MGKKDNRPTSQQIAHQTVSAAGILFIALPFAIVVIGGAMCFACPRQPASTPQNQQGTTITTPQPANR